MDWISEFCRLPPQPGRPGEGPHRPGDAFVVFMPTSVLLSEAGYILDRLGRDCLLLYPPGGGYDLKGPFEHRSGFCWVADIPELAWCGEETPDDFSPLWLWEGGAPLGPARSIHARIAAEGRGGFSHWGRKLFFSASDNSDPNTNKRRYRVLFQARPDWLGLETGRDESEEDGGGERGKVEVYGYGLGPGNEIILPPKCPASALWARAIVALDLNPWGGAAWPHRRYLRQKGLKRLLFRRGLEWAEISLAGSAKASVNTLVGRGLGRIGGLLGGPGGRSNPAGQEEAPAPSPTSAGSGALMRTARRLIAQGSRRNGRPPVKIIRPPGSADVLPLFEREIREDNALVGETPPLPEQPRRMVLYTGGLESGGGERGLAMLASAARDQGHEVRVLTTRDPSAEAGHYREDLENLGIPVSRAGTASKGEILRKAALSKGLKRSLISRTPLELRKEVVDLLGDLLVRPPDVLLCWLDQPNIIGGTAGFLAGLGRVVFSVQSLNPSHFPEFNQPWLRDWYRLLAQSRRIRLSAISRAAANDYAGWLGLEPSRFGVIPTGLNFRAVDLPTPEERAAFRAGLGVDEDVFLVAGVFRLSPEKRPTAFLEVIKRVAARGIKVKAVMAGEGPLSGRLESEILRLGLKDTVIPLGLRKDVFKVMGGCDALLHTPEIEGLGLVLLEAQYLGLPVVATDVDGIPEAVFRDESGFLHPKDDLEGMAASLSRIAADQTLARSMGRAGRAYVIDGFSKERMYGLTMDLIDGAFPASKNRERG